MRRVLLAATLAAFLVTAAPAAASTLTLNSGILTFAASPGAANSLTVSGTTAALHLVINDADAVSPYTVPVGCLSASASDFTCPANLLVLDLGDNADTVSIGGGGLTVATSMTGGDGVDQLTGGGASDTIDGGASNDVLNGGAGADQLLGGDGNDVIGGGGDADTIEGGAANDTLDGGAGNDSLNGADGIDSVTGGPGDDSLSGGNGDDSLEDGGGSDSFSGGPGIDRATLAVRPTVSVTIDGLPNDGAPGESGNVQTDIEDVVVETPSDGSATLIGSDASNQLDANGGGANINGLGGSDFLFGTPANDTITARDGFPDRVSCGGGTDVVIADQFDTASSSCETVQTEVVAGPPALDDHPPAVAWSTPASAASFPGEVAQSLSVTATDDRGLAKVQFYDDDRLLCEDLAAPYTCTYQARGADVGRNTLVAVATDTAGQASTAIRVVNVDKFRPTVPLSLKPSRDRRAPYKFTASGTLTNAGVCSGRVAVTAKAGKRTVSTRRAKVNSKCRYSVSVSFKSRVRSRLKFTARYEGNTSTAARSSSSRTARLG